MKSRSNSKTNGGSRLSNDDEDEDKNKFGTMAREYPEITLMHGIPFIINPRASNFERVLWFVIFGSSFAFVTIFAVALWEHWVQSPVLITVESANYPIAERQPFPAVTICTVNRVSTRAFGEWIASQGKGLGLETEQAREIVKIIITSRYESEEQIRILSQVLWDKSNFSSENHYYDKIMDMLTPTCQEMVVFCSWEGKELDCTNSSFFERGITDRGYCCSFNAIAPFTNGTFSNKDLRYARQSGVYAGMTIVLDAQIADYNVTSSDTTGFKVSIQSPDTFPTTARTGFLISPGRQYDVAITGFAQMADSDIGSIPLDKRICTLDDELKLTYFSGYTSDYCMLDCLATLLLRRCHCVLYFFPLPEDIPICNLKSYVCVKKTMDYQIANVSACYCPDECNQTWYRSEVTLGVYPNPVSNYPQSILKREPFNNMSVTEFHKYAQNNFAKLNVFLKSKTGVAYVVGHRMYWADFFGAIGGLLDAFGFSFSLLSLAEVFYFVFIRWTYYFKHLLTLKKRSHPSTQNLQAPRRPLPNITDLYVTSRDDSVEEWKIDSYDPPSPQYNNWVEGTNRTNRSKKKEEGDDGRYIPYLE